MSSPPPTKPPRGVKQGKETSGLLMSVIRTLSASETNEQRDREKAKLEKEYKKSDQRLDELVSVQADQLTHVMQIFSASCGAVNTCRARLRGARARLSACRGLLRVRRDELRRLWADARQHKYALDMLAQIERLVSVDKEISMHMSQGHYLNAASVLQSALQLSNTELAQVDALQHLRIDLENKKQSLLERTMAALRAAVYRSEAALRRVGSGRDRTQPSDLPLILADLTRCERSTDESPVDINTELELSLTEEEKSPRLQMEILIESLAVLDKVKDSTEKLKVQMQTELLEVIATLSQQVIDFGTTQLSTSNYPAPDSASNLESDSVNVEQPLVELVTCLLESCKLVAQRQQMMLDIWTQCINKHKHDTNDVQLYTMQHYWSSVQAVLQLLLTDYLDIQNLTLNTQRTIFTAPEASTDINVYFTKKKALTKKKVPLFKFAQSEDADHNSLPVPVVPVRGNSYQLVCPPKPDNLIHIYHILERFMHEIETNTGVEECSLRAFISDHIRTAETERLGAEAKAMVDVATSAPGAWRQVQRAPAPTDASRPEPAATPAVIFSCAVSAWTATSRAALLGAGLGAGAGAVSAPLVALVSMARAAHRHQLAPVPLARSAKWTADEDIVRFLKSLPNWHNLKYTPSSKKRGPSLNHVMDQDMKQSFEREAEILGSSLGDGTVSHKEIISNNNLLRDIAIMCETMDWLASCVRGIPASVSHGHGVDGQPASLSEAALSELAAAALQLEELSDNCLLLLHLELRIQCFHYLGQEDTPGSVGEGGLGAEGVGSTLAAESGAVRLAGAVRTFHEDALAVLQPTKMNYIMQGVGEMMSAGVVSRCQAGAGGAAAQAQRLAALRHCLAAVGLPGDGLHRAAHYLDVLTMTPEEIITMVEEKGPQFSELEYLNAFNLIGKFKNISDSEMKLYLNKLSNILGNVGVTV